MRKWSEVIWVCLWRWQTPLCGETSLLRRFKQAQLDNVSQQLCVQGTSVLPEGSSQPWSSSLGGGTAQVMIWECWDYRFSYSGGDTGILAVQRLCAVIAFVWPTNWSIERYISLWKCFSCLLKLKLQTLALAAQFILHWDLRFAWVWSKEELGCLRAYLLP